MERTQVRTTRVRSGVYRSLNGGFEVERAEDGKSWVLYRLPTAHSSEGREQLADGFKTSDLALTRIVEQGEVTLEALNTTPAKPKAAKPQPKPEASEPGVSERRSGATGEAPPAPPKQGGGRPSVKRGARKVA